MALHVYIITACMAGQNQLSSNIPVVHSQLFSDKYQDFSQIRDIKCLKLQLGIMILNKIKKTQSFNWNSNYNTFSSSKFCISCLFGGINFELK